MSPRSRSREFQLPRLRASIWSLVIMITFVGAWIVYMQFRIDVPSKHIAILTHKTGLDLTNDMEIAPSEAYRGIQVNVLSEGRYFYNPYHWEWEVVPMFEVPTGKLGVAIRMTGDDLPYGEIIARKEEQKGIVEEVLRAGRYPINPYATHVELYDPITIPAGFKGVVTLLAAPMPESPNQLLVEAGKRGAQQETLEPGTYYFNPYVKRVSRVDCRSQRFDLGEEGEMGFPSKDGFWVSLDGVIEFRIKPENAAEVFVTYNDNSNGDDIAEEVISKVIMPNARSFCRLRGSDKSGRDFIGGDTRIQFQKDFQEVMREKCEPHGIEIIQALITQIKPPQAIAGPVRDREVAHQKLNQYTQQIRQQQSEMKLAVEMEMVKRSQALVAAAQDVVTMTVEAKREQEVAVTKARENLSVAQLKLEAAKDTAAATLARGKAEADVIQFENEAEAAGWARSVEAFGSGEEFARYVLNKALAPGFSSIMANTADSPLMDVFKSNASSPANDPTLQGPPVRSAGKDEEEGR
ncbi:MAG: band 7 protein [Planctomycetes bacterium]|nr:band 7 protein [Planctomycetota bacterium]